MTMIYYVYAYIRDKDSDTAKAGSPYYIGMGTFRRAFDKKHRVEIPASKSNIIIISKNLTNFGARVLERKLIRWYGRKDLGTGILHNKSDGGEATRAGPSIFKNIKIPDASVKKKKESIVLVDSESYQYKTVSDLSKNKILSKLNSKPKAVPKESNPNFKIREKIRARFS